MVSLMLWGCDVLKRSLKFIPLVARITLAPFGFILVFILALMNVDISDYAWITYGTSHFHHILSVCTDTFVSLLFLVLVYRCVLTMTKTYSKKEMVTGVVYLGVFQVIFLIFSLSDLVITLKNVVEHMLQYTGHWIISDEQVPEVMERQRNERDLWISVIYLIANTSLSMLITVRSRFLLCPALRKH